jgi:class 3 adenylate cyclase/tetratricopeptide (TPR) repeat protein
MVRAQRLSAFLPRLVLDRLARTGPAPATPTAQRLSGAVLWADVSGFTPLVERLSRGGAGGAETLSEALSVHFGRLIELVEAGGGDVLFLAGDGALALWPVAVERDLPAARARAEAVAHAMVAELDGSAPQPDVTIRLRVAASCGSLTALTVGGVDDRWLDVLVGGPLRDLRHASVATPTHPALTVVGRTDAPVLMGPPPAVDARALARYVPPPVVARVEAGQSEFLAELRTMTVVFVDLSALGQEPELERLQEVVAIAQTALAELGGSVYQLVQDDKGTSLIAVFGLPGGSHEDDPVRGTRFARLLVDRLAPLAGAVSCGVSTGPLFSGACGLPRRCQYTLFGRPMNRAARLMEAAGGDVLLDEETHGRVAQRLQLGAAQRLVLKGLDGPLTAYAGRFALRDAPVPVGALVGRRAERELLETRVAALVERGQGGAVVVYGPPGIGKTALLGELRRACEARSCAQAFGGADLVESRTPLHAVRAVLRALLGVPAGLPADEIEAHLGRMLGEVGENQELAPLVSQALDHPCEDSALTSQMTPSARAEISSRLLLALARLAARRAPFVAVVDDLHWADAATVALLPQLAMIPGTLWVLASRPGGSASDALAGLAGRGTDVPLAGLGEADVAALAARTLGARAIPEALAALLVERGGGNPLYSRELALALRETRRLTVVGGVCALAPSFRPESARDLPSSLAALVKSRIDRLPPGTQVALRVASVIGPSFERRILADVLAAEADGQPPAVDDALGDLARDGFLVADGAGADAQQMRDPDRVPRPPATGADGRSPSSPTRFSFGHAVVQAVAYELLPERQRARLHGAVARALEVAYGAATPAVYGRLSHHWHEAREPAKAAAFSALAARRALDGYANRDAVDLYRRALENLEASEGPRAFDLRRARLHAGLAQAHYGLTEARASRAAFEAALRHVGLPDPGAGGAVLLGIARHLGARAARALGVRPRPREATGAARERALAALSILAEWVTLDFWEGRPMEGAAKAFLGYRLAGPVLSSPLAAEAIARLGYVLAVTPFRFMALGELERAVELAVASGDLQAIASARVLLGMFYTLSGRAPAALRPLEEAQGPAEKLGVGLWRHRTRFMLGETLLCLGRYAEAGAAFIRAAEISVAVEPPVAGMSMCMRALAVAREGRLGEALAIIEGPTGLPIISGNFLPLQRFTALGVQAEVLARLGRVEEAVAVAREAQVLAARGQDCDVFFAGLHGHAGVVEAHLARWAADGRAGGTDARRALARLRRFADLYPAAWPRTDLLAGRWRALAGRPRAAARRLRRALARARAMALAYEQREAAAALDPAVRP